MYVPKASGVCSCLHNCLSVTPPITALAKGSLSSIPHKRAGQDAIREGAENRLSTGTRVELMPQITSQNYRGFSR